MPSRIARESGASTNGNEATSPNPKALICKMTEASEVRKISGSVKSGLDAKLSAEYRRIAMPSATRPQRPER